MAAAPRVVVLAILIAAAATPARAQPAAQGPAHHEFNSAVIARQLGTKLAPKHDVEFQTGVSVTGTLSDPSQLAKYGFDGVQAGARVTTMRASDDRIVVEVDEATPTPRTRRVMLRIDSAGQITSTPQDLQAPKTVR